MKPVLEELPKAPPGVFRGVNMLTPTPTRYFRRQLRGRTAYVELSTGTALIGEGDLYGVTFRWVDGGELWRTGKDPSTCFHSEAEALRHAEEVE